MNLKIKDILKCTNGKLIIGDTEKECKNYSKDTRTIKKGDTYIGIKGEKFDGSSFWKDALNNGAETVIINNIKLDEIEEYKKQNKNIIQVEDTIEAIGEMASYKMKIQKEKYNLKVVGVTGSVGKTSTKDIIANVLSKKYKVLKTEGNNNNHIGLPLTILRLQNEEIAVIEMGMNHLGEISYLTKIAKPDIAVITNIGTSHIGNLGSRENILKAKLEILEGMDKKKIVINNDNDLLNKWYLKNKNNIEIHTFGIKNESEFNAKNIKLKENSSEFTCENKNEKMSIEVPVGGEHFILNALCGLTVGKLLNLNNEEIKKGIKDFKLTAKRMEINHLKNNITIINDSYNASYESMKASISNLKNMNGERKIAVLGDMFELGDFSEKLHKEVGTEIYKNKIDKLYLIGNYSKFIGEEAEKEGYKKENIFYFENKDELFNNLKNNLKSGDVILIKASNGMKLFEIAEKLKNINI
ncbi:MAG: UDP-N-acetylmuramoyl-tripeptide--D-alanyl-D-alanine ligase [Clostridia bacterium]